MSNPAPPSPSSTSSSSTETPGHKEQATREFVSESVLGQDVPEIGSEVVATGSYFDREPMRYTAAKKKKQRTQKQTMFDMVHARK